MIRAIPCADSEYVCRMPSIVANASSSGSTISSSIVVGDALSIVTTTPTKGMVMSG